MALGRIADTSWLYALFDEADAFHVEARASVTTPLVTLVPTAVMDETLDLIAYRTSRANALAAEEAMRGLPHFDLWCPVEPEDARAAWLEHPGASMHDAHVIALSRKTGFPPATFDEAQRAACGPKP